MLVDIIIITFLFSLFAVSHSFLVSYKTKKLLAEKLGNKIAFYRLFYNISSILIFLFIFIISPKPTNIIYDLQFPFDIVIFVFQIISVLGLIWAISKVNLQEFIGISQIKRYLEDKYDVSELDERMEFIIEGPFKFSRHPIYLFTILFLAFRPTMDLFYFIFFMNICLYFYIGSYFEEKKLVEIFGQRYLEYQKFVPRVFSFNFIKKKNNR